MIDDWDCPLCLEEMDLPDRYFQPCPCGYQICRFCMNNISLNMGNKCPACRREYREEDFVTIPLTEEQQKEDTDMKRNRETESKEMQSASRKHLSAMRVLQRNLVYAVGIPGRVADERTLASENYFGQFGPVSKVIINRRNVSMAGTISAYITYVSSQDAAECIQMVDGSLLEGRVIKATHGTTKYCNFYLRGLNCPNQQCMYLHSQGESIDSFTKEEMTKTKQSFYDSERHGRTQVLGIKRSDNADKTISANERMPHPASITQSESSATQLHPVRSAGYSPYDFSLWGRDSLESILGRQPDILSSRGLYLSRKNEEPLVHEPLSALNSQSELIKPPHRQVLDYSKIKETSTSEVSRSALVPSKDLRPVVREYTVKEQFTKERPKRPPTVTASGPKIPLQPQKKPTIVKNNLFSLLEQEEVNTEIAEDISIQIPEKKKSKPPKSEKKKEIADDSLYIQSESCNSEELNLRSRAPSQTFGDSSKYIEEIVAQVKESVDEEIYDSEIDQVYNESEVLKKVDIQMLEGLVEKSKRETTELEDQLVKLIQKSHDAFKRE